MRRLVLLLLVTIPVLAVEDHAIAPSPTADTQGKHEAGGKWRLSVDALPKGGGKTVTAQLEANAPIPSGFGQVTPVLVLRYRSGEISAYVVFDTYLGEGQTHATVTFDHQSPEAQMWEISDDNRAAFVPGDALTFIQRLKHVETFAVRVTPHHSSPVTATFTIKGIEVVTKALFSAGVQVSG